MKYLLGFGGALAVLVSGGSTNPATTLAVDGTRFTLNGQPAFLRGMSYYGALGAPEETVRRDLDELKQRGFNWIRVWATWSPFDDDVSAVDGEGRPRAAFTERLKRLLAECDRRGLVVDVTLSRGNGITGARRLQTLDAHRRAVETLVNELKESRNWYLDLANERNTRDRRFASYSDLKELRQLVKQIDAGLLVTASHAGDISRADLREYLLTVPVDFLSPHRPRHPESPGQSEAKTREYLAWMKDLGREVPVHYQEPFRRGYGKWQPAAADYVTDLNGARAGGAAGWCFHNGDQRDRPEGRPRRSFDLRERRRVEQLDDEERKALEALGPRA
jgi:endo-1,4-beta-mannosidase